MDVVMAAEVNTNTYFFEGALYNIASRSDLFCLPNSIHAVKCLILDHGIPVHSHQQRRE